MDLVERLKADRAQLVAAHQAHLETLDLVIERLGHIQAFAAVGPKLHNGSNGSRRANGTNGTARNGHSVRAVFRAVPDWSTTSDLKALAPNLSSGSVYSLITLMTKAGELKRRGSLGKYQYRGTERA